MSYIFKDAVDVKVEYGEDVENQGIEKIEGGTTAENFWEDLKMKVDYLKTERGSMQFYREGFIQVMKTAVTQVFVKRWAKTSISSFIKEIYFNKEGFFTKDQIKELDDIMADLNNESAASARKLI